MIDSFVKGHHISFPLVHGFTSLYVMVMFMGYARLGFAEVFTVDPRFVYHFNVVLELVGTLLSLSNVLSRLKLGFFSAHFG